MNLNYFFILTDLFFNFDVLRLCAGGELQKSNCDGDDGNPLVIFLI
jgi:hypothetical protein